MEFAKALNLQKGLTAIIGSGGKTSLMLHLAQELSERARVIVTTSTHIFPPKEIPITEEIQGDFSCICVGTPCENGKLTTPRQSFEELKALADYVLIEADGSKHLPLKAHLAHEPVIPDGADVVCVVGASGLDQPICETVHRFERFFELTGSEIATPNAVAKALQAENFARIYLINQIDTNENAARLLASLLPQKAVLSCLNKGEIICSF
ncbi:MAG: putative selenium-dependent hydroxylase accessory protein YqeC [Ruminococcaceae bacterium]|nr:putative selenium-dependent hydroxylase accessory protein YqeC [Oscillospiraceae bacterium]